MQILGGNSSFNGNELQIFPVVSQLAASHMQKLTHPHSCGLS